MTCKRADELTPEDFAIFPVWEFALDMEEVDETLVRPVRQLPVYDLDNRIVGANVRLANGTRMCAGIQNIDLKSALKTRHLLSLSLFCDGGWFHLDRYHDYNVEQYGPVALAGKLGLEVDKVFPISYDVSNCCVGDPHALIGTIESDPKDKLGRDEIFELIVGKRPTV